MGHGRRAPPNIRPSRTASSLDVILDGRRRHPLHPHRPPPHDTTRIRPAPHPPRRSKPRSSTGSARAIGPARSSPRGATALPGAPSVGGRGLGGPAAKGPPCWLDLDPRSSVSRRPSPNRLMPRTVTKSPGREGREPPGGGAVDRGPSASMPPHVVSAAARRARERQRRLDHDHASMSAWRRRATARTRWEGVSEQMRPSPPPTPGRPGQLALAERQHGRPDHARVHDPARHADDDVIGRQARSEDADDGDGEEDERERELDVGRRINTSSTRPPK